MRTSFGYVGIGTLTASKVALPVFTPVGCGLGWRRHICSLAAPIRMREGPAGFQAGWPSDAENTHDAFRLVGQAQRHDRTSASRGREGAISTDCGVQ